MKDILDKIIVLYQGTKEIYERGVLLSINRDSIHVTEEFIRGMPGKLFVKRQVNDSRYPFSAHKYYAGVEFFALSKKPIEEAQTMDSQIQVRKALMEQREGFARGLERLEWKLREMAGEYKGETAEVLYNLAHQIKNEAQNMQSLTGAVSW